MYLWRGDDSKPPAEWDANFAQKTKYGIWSMERGPKNKAGLFFFSDNRGMAEGYCTELHRENNSPELWLTSAQSITSLKIIDFSKASSVFEALRILDFLGCDVIHSSFLTYDEDGGETAENFRSFKEFREPYDVALKLWEKGLQTKEESVQFDSLVEKIEFNNLKHSSPLSFFGQRLTDYENGPELIKRANASCLQADGYRWREHDDERGLTYCLFSSSKLSPPESMELKLHADPETPHDKAFKVMGFKDSQDH